ncbi:MAG TPA: DUF5666 domain-containing protein [Vicinamibacterales bacterium]|nr:DUF5666 domain-containing protein [Vicinamibacterales bacterium]
MRRTILTLPLAALAFTWLCAADTLAQDTKTARGTVTAVTGNSISVKVGESEMKFDVDAKTTLTARGAGTAARKAGQTGTAGPKVADFVKVGDPVEVRYHAMGGTMHAADIRRVASAGRGTGSAGGEASAERSDGTVDAVTASSLTITGSSGGGSTFKQTFTVDPTTKVIGVGAGTASAAKGGRMAITDYVSTGDRVTVSYHKMGSTLHAAEVRVRAKGK